MRSVVGAATALLVLGLVAGCDHGERTTGPRLFLLLTVDTLRADHLGAYGSQRGLTPRLDALAADSLVFDSAYALAPFTVPSLMSLHTGHHPIELGFRTNLSKLSDSVDTLAEIFARRGWKTAAVVSNPVLRHRHDLAQGFEIYDDTMKESEAVRGWPERIAAPTTDAALALVNVWRNDPAVSGRPLFLWVHYQDPHGPYTPPAGFRERFLDLERRESGGRRLPVVANAFGDGGIPRYQHLDGHDDVAFYHAGYDGEIAYMDQEVGRLLDTLRADGLLSSVVFAADHGEAMGEHGFWFAHGHHLTDEVLHVPLFVHLPGLEPGRRSDVVSLLDLVPTLLPAILGMPAPSGLEGRNLLAKDAASHHSVPLLSTLDAYPHHRLGIVAEGYKLILTLRDHVWVAELYRRGHEDVDLAAPAPEIVARLRKRVWALHDRIDRGVVAPVRKLTEQERRDLEALGYTQGAAP